MPLRFPGRFILLIALFVSAPVMRLIAADNELGTPVGVVSVPAGITEKELRETIITCFVAREWSVKEKSGDRVIGYLNHRGNEATMTVTFTDLAATFYCDGWKVDKTGKRVKPELPTGWIENLKKDLAKRLAKSSALK